jgi:phosphate/sulfate permease
MGSPAQAYAVVFAAEAMLFVLAAVLAAKVSAHSTTTGSVAGTGAMLVPIERG